MFKRINQFLHLAHQDKKLFIEAFTTLGIMRAAILSISFKRLTRSLEHSKDNIDTEPLTAEQLKIAVSIGKAIEQAANNTPWESACLAQSLAAQRMLQKRGIAGVFYLGVMKDETSKEKMKAHAWSQCGNEIITGGAGHEEFTVLSVFGWH